MGLQRLIYYSDSRLDPRDDTDARALQRIMEISKARNEAAGITGLLMFTRSGFAQILEGPRAALEETFERIQSDSRHSNVRVLTHCAITERTFESWEMSFVGAARGGEIFERFLAEWGDLASWRGWTDELCRQLRTTLREDELMAATESLPAAATVGAIDCPGGGCGAPPSADGFARQSPPNARRRHRDCAAAIVCEAIRTR
ncbi:MAG: BLUF domain-containing protein [Alphaproteobacteria bacterium]